MKHIAIIPAKANSSRCPGKNLRSFVGHPLFLHSVFYARREGVEPIVSTDSEEVMAICQRQRVRFLREVVDDSNMSNCVRQVLERVPCDSFAMLQPTSPMRLSGMLRRMLETLESHQCETAFTAWRLKPIGLWEGRFLRAYRDQDTKVHFMHFDGNILVATRAFFERTGELFDDCSLPFENTFPCTLQIDSEDEFTALQHLAMHGSFSQFLPSNVRRVCIVSNRHAFLRDYSSFVDGCDVVIRISKMENLDDGLTGQKTDMAVVACWGGYLAYSRAQRHVEALKNVPMVFFDPETIELTRRFCEQEGITRWAFIPEAEQTSSWHFSTFGKAVLLADRLFPDAELFSLADLDVSVRTSNSPKHTYSGEQAYVDSLVKSGRLKSILEEGETPEGGYTYSLPIPEEKRPLLLRMKLRIAPGSVKHEVVQVRHPRWRDSLRIAEDVACRVHGGDCARITERSDTGFSLKWDRWGKEQFSLQSDGVYHFFKSDGQVGSGGGSR